MRHFHLLRNHYYRPTINIDKLVALPEAKADAPAGTVPVIDLVNGSAHAWKLLGKGAINKPFIVKARYVSKQAEEKITAAGGVVKLIA